MLDVKAHDLLDDHACAQHRASRDRQQLGAPVALAPEQCRHLLDDLA
jgi:hypothetical protein